MKTEAVLSVGMWSTGRHLQPLKQRLEAENIPVHIIEFDRSNLKKMRASDYARQYRSFFEARREQDIKFLTISHSMSTIYNQLADDSRIITRILMSPAPVLGIGEPPITFSEAVERASTLPMFLSSTLKPDKKLAEKFAVNCHAKQGLPWDLDVPPESRKTLFDIVCGIKVPKRENVHVIVGEEDKLTPQRIARALNRYHNGNSSPGTIHLFPRNDHYSVLQTKEVLDEVARIATNYASTYSSPVTA